MALRTSVEGHLALRTPTEGQLALAHLWEVNDSFPRFSSF
jgi:hypothetical protein